MIIQNFNLESVDIGRWRNYQSYINKEQLAEQRAALNFTGLLSGNGEVSFIYTKYMEELLDHIENLSNQIKIEDTETVVCDEVFYTCKIEGSNTTRKRTSEIHNGAKVDSKSDYSEIMVRNGFEAVKLMNLIGSGTMSKDVLVRVWNVLVKDACDNEEIRGTEFRSGAVSVGQYEGADVSQIPELVDNWVRFYNSTTLEEKPFLKAMLLHYAFETIHPFCDGNGRLGRLLINNYLISRGIDSARAVSFSMQIDKRRAAYDAAFVDAENLYNDCTPFLEYMLEIALASYGTALEITKIPGHPIEDGDPDTR